MTKEEKQRFRLERLFANNDKLKDQRVKIPILINSLSLAIAAFSMKENQVLNDNVIRILVTIIILANEDFICPKSSEVIFANAIWIGIYVSYGIFSTLSILVISFI